MAEYDALRARHAERLAALLPDYVARLTAPAAELRALRTSQLRAILAHAKARSSWHGRRLAAIDPARVDASDLRRLPTMTKDDLMAHFDEIVTDPRLTRDVAETHLTTLDRDAYLLDEYHVCASGGSSGRRGAFVYDFDAWAATFASLIRFGFRMDAELSAGVGAVRAIIAADKASHMTSAFAQTFVPPTGAMHRFPASQPLAQIVDGLNALQPDRLTAYASMLRQLTSEAAAGRLRIAPRQVWGTSEPVLPEIREAVAATWGVPVANMFGSTEGLMGSSCPAWEGLHLSDDVFVIEPVDARGEPVPPGERAAKVYLTSLINRTQPLIRYELSDEMTVMDGACPCGSALLRIEDIQGRLDDCFTWRDGPTVHPFVFRSVLGRARDVVEYQVRQTPRGADVLVVCRAGVDTAAIAAALRRSLDELGLADADVTVRRVAALERQATGKLKRFVALEG